MITEKIVSLSFTKSTKNKHVYGDVSDGAAIPTLYIDKAALPSTPPATIKVTIDWKDA